MKTMLFDSHDVDVSQLEDPYWTCIYCGKKVSAKKKYAYFVHVMNGGNMICDTEEELTGEHEAGDMAFFPIGPECRKKLPPEFVFKQEV